MTVPVDSSVPTKVLFTDHTLLVFSIFFSIIDLMIAVMDFTQKLSKNDDFFTFSNSLFKN